MRSAKKIPAGPGGGFRVARGKYVCREYLYTWRNNMIRRGDNVAAQQECLPLTLRDRNLSFGTRSFGLWNCQMPLYQTGIRHVYRPSLVKFYEVSGR